MMKCSEKAFSKCPDRRICVGDATFNEGSECDKFNQQVENEVITRLEKIRSMSAEELADFLLYVDQQNLTVDVCNDCPGYPNCSDDCRPAIVRYLLQPYAGKSPYSGGHL